MAQLTVTINGRNYQVACDDGQEAHLARLGTYIDNRVKELVAAVGQVGDARLLVMVSLLLADELSDAYSSLDVAQHVRQVYPWGQVTPLGSCPCRAPGPGIWRPPAHAGHGGSLADG
jgi:cell division protein ZapA